MQASVSVDFTLGSTLLRRLRQWRGEMSQQIKRLLVKCIVIGILPLAFAALIMMQGCATPARDHYVNLTHAVVEIGTPEHDEVAIAFGLPLYQPPTEPDTESALVEVPTTEQP